MTNLTEKTRSISAEKSTAVGRFGTTAVEVGAVDFWRPTANTTEYQKLALQISKIAQIFTHFKFEKLLRLGLFILGELKFAVILAHEINNDQTEH